MICLAILNEASLYCFVFFDKKHIVNAFKLVNTSACLDKLRYKHDMNNFVFTLMLSYVYFLNITQL